jgi:DNA-binding SARP family transcriptional activator
VRAWHADTEIPVGPPQVRSLLAILLAQIGRPVSLAEIVESLWGQQPPARAINAVHGHISTLRRALEPDLRSRETGRWLRRAAGGYLLAADAGRVDLLEFRDLVARARGADGQDRADLHAAALRLWTGQCGSNIDPSVRTLPIFGELDRECFAVAREAADAAIASGQAGRVVAVVRSAADRDLLDEPLQARLILLLAASGQQAQALGRFEQVRSALADDLGVDPGGELRAAQGVVLRQSDPAAPPPGTPTPPAPEFWGTRPRPAQLPSDLSTFSGRESELGQAASLLPRVGARSRGATIVAISGMAGVGKTTLAIHWAHQLADQYPDGQLYVNLRGFDPIGRVVDPTEPLANILEALGAAPDRMPRTAESRAALFRSLLAGRRMLVVIDNARDADQARPLLPGSADCLVIVTSRNRLAGLVAAQGAHPLALRTLSDEAARVLLARRLGVARLDADPEATSAVIRYCGGLPLALAIVAARAVIRAIAVGHRRRPGRRHIERVRRH